MIYLRATWRAIVLKARAALTTAKAWIKRTRARLADIVRG